MFQWKMQLANEKRVSEQLCFRQAFFGATLVRQSGFRNNFSWAKPVFGTTFCSPNRFSEQLFVGQQQQICGRSGFRNNLSGPNRFSEQPFFVATPVFGTIFFAKPFFEQLFVGQQQHFLRQKQQKNATATFFRKTYLLPQRCFEIFWGSFWRLKS